MQCFLALRSGPEPSGGTLLVAQNRFLDSALEQRPEGRIRAVGAAVIPGNSPARSGAGEAEDCWERRGSAGRPGWGLARGVLPSAPPLHDTKGSLSSLLAAGKGSG